MCFRFFDFFILVSTDDQTSNTELTDDVSIPIGNSNTGYISATKIPATKRKYKNGHPDCSNSNVSVNSDTEERRREGKIRNGFFHLSLISLEKAVLESIANFNAPADLSQSPLSAVMFWSLVEDR